MAYAKKLVRRAKSVKKTLTILPKEKISPDEVVFLENQAASQLKSERSWLSMTAPPEEEDRWGAVEDHLLAKPHESAHNLRRWKYFSK